jgi:Peptidase family S41
MKYTIIIVLLVFFPGGKNSFAQTQMTPDKWREDINYFANQLTKKHKNAFHAITTEQFNQAITDLTNAVVSLPDYQVAVKLQQITASVGDAHTYVHLPDTFKRYPIGLYWFDKDLYAIRTMPEYKAALGTRLVKIGELTIAQVNEKLSSVLSQSENKWFDLNNSPGYIMVPEILVTLGIVSDLGHASFVFLDENNKEVKLDLVPVTSDPKAVWLPAAKQVPLSRQRPTEQFWFTYLDDINAVYVNFKSYDDLNQNLKKLFDLIEEKKAIRLIIDIRQNGGGDYTKVRRGFIPLIKENPVLNQKDNLYIITGRRTFSAAMTNAIDFKKETNATIIGEPPGEKPNSYQENDEMKLPNSGLVISYSTKYYKFLDEDVPAFMPDVQIEPNWKDYMEGRDPVMEWIINNIKKAK